MDNSATKGNSSNNGHDDVNCEKVVIDYHC